MPRPIPYITLKFNNIGSIHLGPGNSRYRDCYSDCIEANLFTTELCIKVTKITKKTILVYITNKRHYSSTPVLSQVVSHGRVFHTIPAVRSLLRFCPCMDVCVAGYRHTRVLLRC